MSSEGLQITALEPFIQKFTVELIRVFKEKGINPKQRFILHDDLVPRFSQRVQERSMRERNISPEEAILIPLREVPLRGVSLEFEELPFAEPLLVKDQEEIPVDNSFRQNEQVYTQVLSEPPTVPVIHPLQKRPPVQVPQVPRTPQVLSSQEPAQVVPEIQEPAVQGDIFAQGPYGRITMLLYDPSVSVIDCNGPGKPVLVTRYGRKQITKINLSSEEITAILDKVSQEAHIPLMEGIFRAAVDDFSVTAIISDIVGSKFSIKKNIPMQVPGVGGY